MAMEWPGPTALRNRVVSWIVLLDRAARGNFRADMLQLHNQSPCIAAAWVCCQPLLQGTIPFHGK